MTHLDMSKKWTKVLALAIMGFAVSACAVSEKVEQYSQDQVDLVQSSSKSRSLSLSSSSEPIEATIYRSDVSGIDWRTQIGKTITDKDLYGYVIQDHQHRRFNFYTANGDRLWMNYTFFWNRNDVWYNIVSDKDGVLQSGWTTVSLSQQKIGGRNVMYINWDVAFHPATQMKQKLAVAVSGSEHRGVVTSSALTSDPGRGNFAIWTEHQPGSAFTNTNIKSTIVRDTNTGRHWEKQLANSGFTSAKLTNSVFSNNTPRQFHYYTAPDGDKYWLTLTFFKGSPLVAYGFISDKRGGLQHGWTTLDVVRSVRTNQEVVRLDLHVTPHPGLNMQTHIYMWLNSKNELRGSITNNSYTIPNFNKGNFGIGDYGKLFYSF